ncbi:hypothetical protein QOZ80_8BG0666120 [Eleusine coracana subsp. coracana]|nr:hypothetical protein QOZ80_8BG0666120 [Eleusine coracana subsp. coracana]
MPEVGKVAADHDGAEVEVVAGIAEKAAMSGDKAEKVELEDRAEKVKMLDAEMAGMDGDEAEVVADNAEKEKMVEDVPHFDNNILSQIAVHLPTKAAYRWNTLAPIWSRYTAQPIFFKDHLSPRRLEVEDTPAALLVQPRTHERLGYVHALVVAIPDDDDEPVPDYVSFFICFPERNRFIKLPAPPVAPSTNTVAAIHYDHLNAGGIEFRVVLLRADGNGHLLLDKFTSASVDGAWESHDLGLCGDVDLGIHVPSTGISIGGPRYHWLDWRHRVVSYDEASGTASVFDEPPPGHKGWRRHGRALGSVDAGSKVRFSAFDTFDPDPLNAQLHSVNALYRVWDLNQSGVWEPRVEQVRHISEYYYGVALDHEVPYDYAGATASSCIYFKKDVLTRRDLVSGHTTEMFNLKQGMGGRTAELYVNYDVFPIFL